MESLVIQYLFGVQILGDIAELTTQQSEYVMTTLFPGRSRNEHRILNFNGKSKSPSAVQMSTM